MCFLACFQCVPPSEAPARPAEPAPALFAAPAALPELQRLRPHGDDGVAEGRGARRPAARRLKAPEACATGARGLPAAPGAGAAGATALLEEQRSTAGLQLPGQRNQGARAFKTQLRPLRSCVLLLYF